MSSNISDASTEPWFCEPCRANVKHPTCQVEKNQLILYRINRRSKVGEHTTPLDMDSLQWKRSKVGEHTTPLDRDSLQWNKL